MTAKRAAASLVIAAQLLWPAAGADAARLAPVVDQSWVTGSCAAPEEIVDWVIDKDGEVYRRDGGYTHLTYASFVKGEFTTHDEVGIGLTRSVYRLKDGKLRLWDEAWYEGGDVKGTATVVVREGRVLEGDDATAKLETSDYAPCPLRAMFPPEPIAALNGKWAALDGGSCAIGTGAILFDLERPVPRISRGAVGDMAAGDAYVLSIAGEGESWVVTEGSAMEASIYRFALGRDGALTQTGEDGNSPIRFQRCM
jgi:hypothetical protein